MIRYSCQDITESDINAVIEALRSAWLTQGPIVCEFESLISEYSTAAHAVAVNSATSALHIACLALGVGRGDIVWTSANTFVASANCARYCGATVDFVDIDPETWNMSVERLAEKLRFAKQNNRLPKIVIPVHLCGQSCEMEAIHALSLEYGFRIIEDASHAIGGRYQNQPVGSCRYSDVTVFSFHAVKIITTGEGGVALTRDSDLHKKMMSLRSHGISKDPEDMIGTYLGPWYYEQNELGYGYRMTEIQAALGCSQVGRLDEYIQTRNELAVRYEKLLSDSSVSSQKLIAGAASSYHIYPIRLERDVKRAEHRQIFEKLRSSGIEVNLHYLPVHLHPYYRALGFCEGMYPEAEVYSRTAITLPLFPNLTMKEQDYIVDILKSSISSTLSAE